MQTYTHATIGALAGVVFFPHNPTAQVACIAGAVAPDLPTFVRYVGEKLKGKAPFSDWKSVPWYISATHSLVVLAIVLGISMANGQWTSVVKGFFAAGVLPHILMDMRSHTSREYIDVDVTYLWPLPWSLRPSHGWDYRQPKGPRGGHDYVLRLKPLEKFVLIGSILATVVLHLLR